MARTGPGRDARPAPRRVRATSSASTSASSTACRSGGSSRAPPTTSRTSPRCSRPGIVALVRDVFKMIGFAVALFLRRRAARAGSRSWSCRCSRCGAVVFRWKVREAFRAVRVRIARINAYLQETVIGHEGGAALRARGAQPARLRRDERRAPRRLAQVDPLRLGAVLGGRVRVGHHDRDRDLAGRGLRRAPARSTSSSTGCAASSCRCATSRRSTR